MEYIRGAGPPLEVSQVDSTMPSFSICRSVRYNVPGFIASNPNAAARSMSSYPYEFHSRKESSITGTSQFLGRASTLRNSVARTSASLLRSSLSMTLSSISMCILHICSAPSRVQLGVAPKFPLNEDSWFNPRSCLRSQLDAEFTRRPYQDADVVAQDLNQNLADLPHLALAPDRVPELPLHHREGRFRV